MSPTSLPPGGRVLGEVVVAAVVLGTVPAVGAVVLGTPTGAVVVGAGLDGDVDVVDVAGARVAGGTAGAPRVAPPSSGPTTVSRSAERSVATRATVYPVSPLA